MNPELYGDEGPDTIGWSVKSRQERVGEITRDHRRRWPSRWLSTSTIITGIASVAAWFLLVGQAISHPGAAVKLDSLTQLAFAVVVSVAFAALGAAWLVIHNSNRLAANSDELECHRHQEIKTIIRTECSRVEKLIHEEGNAEAAILLSRAEQMLANEGGRVVNLNGYR